MEGPGMSLFQGAASIHINNSAQDRLEEQEELEDQKRRNEELKHKLANAFDDLLDDDEASSVNSSANFTLDAPHNGGRSNLPPTYIESLTHLKEQQHEPPYTETPRANVTDEPVKLYPCGAGDGACYQGYRGAVNGVNSYETHQEYMNNGELKVMYEMRVKECQQLASQLTSLDSEVEALRARLTAAINDRDKADRSLSEAHHLLASSKHKILELEQQIQQLTARQLDTEHDKQQLQLELRSTTTLVQELQHKMHNMQVTHTHDTDNLFREQQDRHREETERLHSDLMKAKSRLEQKDNEIKILERKCLERDKEKDQLLIDKGATINRLARELELAQGRGRGEDRERVAQLTGERNAAREQVKELGSKLESTALELVTCRNKLNAVQKEQQNWINAILHALGENNMDTTEGLSSPAKLSKLKELLSRYKSQANKLTTLHEELDKREKKIEYHKKQEQELKNKLEEQRTIETTLKSKLAVTQNKLELLSTNTDSELVDNYRTRNEELTREIEEIREQKKQLELKYTELELEYDKLKSEKGSRASIVQEANTDLLQELERCGAKLKDALKENGELKNLYLQACSAKDAIARELKDLQTNMQTDKQTHITQDNNRIQTINNLKQQIQQLTTELSTIKQHLEISNKKMVEMQKEFTDRQKEFTEKLDQYIHAEKSVKAECVRCQQLISQIQQMEQQLNAATLKLATQESNDVLMKELKNKAEFFQQYIVDRFKKLTDRTTVGTNTEHTTDWQQVEGKDCDEMQQNTDLMLKEKAIREQIAKKLTLEMQTMEMNFTRQIKEIETRNRDGQAQLQLLLERKAQEVETLKQFVLSERQKVTQILEAKENEISVLIKEHNELQANYHKAKDCVQELKLKVDKYKEKITKLSSSEEIAKNERFTVKEYQNVKSKMMELQQNYSKLEQMYEKLQTDQQTLQDKYRNAKKTIFTYKDYISKKDNHVSNEMSRIQDEYRTIFTRLQNHINMLKNGRAIVTNNDVSERLDQLNNDIARLAQSNYNDTPDLNNK